MKKFTFEKTMLSFTHYRQTVEAEDAETARQMAIAADEDKWKWDEEGDALEDDEEYSIELLEIDGINVDEEDDATPHGKGGVK
jgi:hypothetical protein